MARVLIVHDQQPVLRLLIGAVRGAGYEVMACARSSEVLERVSEHCRPDLVVTHLGLGSQRGTLSLTRCLTASQRWGLRSP